MEFIILLIIVIIIYFLLMYFFEVNMKKIKEIAEDKELDKLVQKYPENIDICKAYLKKLDNTSVNIQEDKNSNTTLYLVISNKIFIANLKNSYTRIQTIAHECLHSIQSKKLLWFNFIFSNIYLVYFFLICVLGIFKLVPFKLMFLSLLIMFGFVFFVVRSYLENDAMIKARFLAKEYMQEIGISSQEEIDRVIEKYDELNDVGIKCTNFQLFSNVVLRVIVFGLICILF